MWGTVGTVEDRWGHPEHPALDVRLEDGHTELFWFYEVDIVEEPPPELSPARQIRAMSLRTVETLSCLRKTAGFTKVLT